MRARFADQDPAVHFWEDSTSPQTAQQATRCERGPPHSLTTRVLGLPRARVTGEVSPS